MMSKYKIFIGSDHAGYDLKIHLKEALGGLCEFVDSGTFGGAIKSCDYPYFAHKTVRKYLAFVRKNHEQIAFGVLICGSGTGMAITANRNRFIRAAVCGTPEMARLAREHNNANFLCLGARFIRPELAVEALKTFLETEFAGKRHARRVKKINPRFYQRTIFVGIYDFFYDLFSKK
jgi:ribose 5-phosphate isomerase B